MRKKNKKAGGKILEGIIYVTGKGVGRFKDPESGKEIEIAPEGLNTALNGDTVTVALRSSGNGMPAGKVARIISRAKNGFAGVLEKRGREYYFLPDDGKMYADILIPKCEARDGDKVFVKITSWKDPRGFPEGKIEKVLGRPGENEAEMEGISLEKGFGLSLSSESEREAVQIKKAGISAKDSAGRKDFRKTPTFTIDPSDAKDFDDAISFKELPSHGGKKEYEIGIHIADVSHYVRPGSELDREAFKRGTSVYLVDRVIPMLPESLSNDLCSLLPGKDRLTVSAVFTLDSEAKIIKEWFGRTIIHSHKRFTYEEAEKAIHAPGSQFHKELSILNTLAKKLGKRRFAHGAVSLDQEEVKFVLDEKGTPIKVVKKERGDSNRLIEEFMLLANRKVAEAISGDFSKKEKGQAGNISVYRVHNLPDPEKMADLAVFLSGIGYKIKLKNGIIPSKEINDILEDLSGKEEKDAVHRAVIRSMAKAVYSTKNIGHYGLAFSHYTHFTSPIRRYPDIVVHRLLLDHLAGKKIGPEKLKMYEKISERSSEMEKRASDAERASVKYKQAEYMSSRVGGKFEGIISGLKEWGLYVEEKETKCEGLVRVRDLDGDFYVFNEKKMELVGERKKKRYRLGDKVRIQVKAVDMERRTIDYVLAK